MIGCINYSTTIECLQYVNDVQNTKYLYTFLLLIFAIAIIYYSKTKNYKLLSKKYESFNLMLKFPIWASYLILFIMFFMPIMLSIQTSLDSFMTIVWAIFIPIIFWFVLFIYLLIYQWIINKLGFKNTKSFIKAARKK